MFSTVADVCYYDVLPASVPQRKRSLAVLQECIVDLPYLRKPRLYGASSLPFVAAAPATISSSAICKEDSLEEAGRRDFQMSESLFIADAKLLEPSRTRLVARKPAKSCSFLSLKKPITQSVIAESKPYGTRRRVACKATVPLQLPSSSNDDVDDFSSLSSGSSCSSDEENRAIKTKNEEDVVLAVMEEKSSIVVPYKPMASEEEQLVKEKQEDQDAIGVKPTTTLSVFDRLVMRYPEHFRGTSSSNPVVTNCPDPAVSSSLPTSASSSELAAAALSSGVDTDSSASSIPSSESSFVPRPGLRKPGKRPADAVLRSEPTDMDQVIIKTLDDEEEDKGKEKEEAVVRQQRRSKRLKQKRLDKIRAINKAYLGLEDCMEQQLHVDKKAKLGDDYWPEIIEIDD